MTPTNTEALAAQLEGLADEIGDTHYTAEVRKGIAELRRLMAELALLEQSNAQLREQNTEVDKACAALEAENSKLLAKVEVAEAGYEAAVRRAEWQASTNAELNRLTEQRNQARAERDALRADAERYRWLREQHEGHEELALDAEGLPMPLEPTAMAFTVFHPKDGGLEPVGCIPGELDAAIDAAMKGTQA